MVEKEPKIVYRPPETAREQEYWERLSFARDIFLLRDGHLSPDLSMETLMTEAVHLLNVYDMDPVFLQDPENSLMTLAITQGLHGLSDAAEREKLLLAFAYGAHRNTSESNFSYSAKVNQLYNSDYTAKVKSTAPTPVRFRPDEVGVIRQNIPQQMATAPQENITIERETEVSGIAMEALLLNLCNRVGVDTSIISQIDVRVLDDLDRLKQVGMVAYTEHLPNGRRRITLAQNSSPHIVEHESLHAILEAVQKGYSGLFWMGSVEGGTEMLTNEPVFYEAQRDVLMELFMKVDDPSFGDDFFEGLKGNYRKWIDFLTILVKNYGLEGYLQLALMDPGATNVLIHHVGKINRIFRNPQHVLEFFAHPKAA